MSALAGMTAIVTGAGRGLGRSHALMLAELGAAVVVNDPGVALGGDGADEGVASQVAKEIVAAGGRAVANTTDIASYDGAAQVVEQAVEEFGDLDIVMNNAGTMRNRAIRQMTPQDWHAVLRVHVDGTLWTTHHASRYWREHRDGKRPRAIINTASGSAFVHSTGNANYVAAKAAVASLTITSAKELAPYGVRVNAVTPWARTRMTASTPELAANVEAVEGTPNDPWDPKRVSRLVALLAEPASTVTGAIIHVAGSEIGLYRGWSVAGVERFEGEDPDEGLRTALARLIESTADRGVLASEDPSVGALIARLMGQPLESGKTR